MKDLANGRKLSFEKEKGTAAYIFSCFVMPFDRFSCLEFQSGPCQEMRKKQHENKENFIGNITFVLVFALNSRTHVNLVFRQIDWKS